MASLAHHLRSLFLFMILVYTSVTGNSVKPSNTACPSFDCGNGLAIRYPFWVQDHQSEFCGYPGFGLSCSGQQPMLNLSGHLYRINFFDLSENTLTMAYSDIINNTVCPVASHGVTVNTSSFLNYTMDTKTLCFFYNCTLYPPSVPSIECLQYGAKRSYVFTTGAIPEFDWQRYCESTVTVPVIDKAVDHGALVNGYAGALHGGFKLRWRIPDSECRSCEATGGFCGYSTDGLHQKFVCFCRDGQHSSACHDNGDLSVTFRPNFVAIGAIIFGSLIIVSTVFYITQKKNIATQKPTFSRIPSTGK